MWNPPIALTSAEQPIAARTRKTRKFFVLLRAHRHALLNADLQRLLAASSSSEPGGQAPVDAGRLALATLVTSMAAVDRARARLRGACWRQGKDQVDVGVQLWLMLCDDHDVIATSVNNGLGHMPLGQEGIHREHPAWEDELAEHCLDLRDLIGFVAHGLLRQRQTDVVGARGEQMDARRTLLA